MIGLNFDAIPDIIFKFNFIIIIIFTYRMNILRSEKELNANIRLSECINLAEDMVVSVRMLI